MINFYFYSRYGIREKNIIVMKLICIIIENWGDEEFFSLCKLFIRYLLRINGNMISDCVFFQYFIVNLVPDGL